MVLDLNLIIDLLSYLMGKVGVNMKKIQWLKRYSKEYGGNKFSAFYGIHTFEYGGYYSLALHFWPFWIELKSTFPK